LPKRREKHRLQHREMAKFYDQGKEYVGVVLNVSEDGLFIQTRNLLPIRSPILVEYGNKDSLSLDGKVVWRLQPSMISNFNFVGGMGIFLSNAPQKWLEIVSGIREQRGSRVGEKRYDMTHPVQYESHASFLTEYTENLSKGGMYLATPELLEPESTIQVELEIPGIPDPIKVTGKVVYRFSEKEAQEHGRPPGVGLQFIDTSDEAKNLLHQYIHRLEIHRSRSHRIDPQEVPPSGSLNDFLVPEILLGLNARTETGILQLTHRGMTKKIYIKKGHPVFVDSSFRYETLGYYLLRQAKLSSEDLEKAIEDPSAGDLLQGECLLKHGLIDQATLAEIFVAHHEEKLINTFAWFDGDYSFSQEVAWPQSVILFPLRTYPIIFEGIERWYDSAIVGSWMGLHENTVLLPLKPPPDQIQLPPRALRLSRALISSKTIHQLSDELKIPLSTLFSNAFGLIIAGWATPDLSGTTAPSSETDNSIEGQTILPQPNKEKLSPLKEARLKSQIEEEYEKFRQLDFYELLGAGPNVSETDLSRSFVQCSSHYTFPLEQISDPSLKEKATQMASGLKLAYETLRDPNLRHIYARRVNRKQTGGNRAIKLDAERTLFYGIREIERKDYKKAVFILSDALKKYSNEPGVQAYLGWALFQLDPNRNLKRAAELLDSALLPETVDPHLFYFRGEVYAYSGDWARAERRFDKALKLFPRFLKAEVAREKAQQKRIEAERVMQKIEKK